MSNPTMQKDDVATSLPPLKWPPPGLEAMQGAAWRVIMLLAVGGLILTVPMLWAVAQPQPVWSTGIFGASWWVLLTTTTIGITLVIGALERGARLLLAGARAARLGYDWNTIALIASDSQHDTGFLLQGMRHYTLLGDRERRLLLRVRIIAMLCYATSLLWLPLALALGLVLAGHGRIRTGTGLFLFVVLPAVLIMLAGLVTRVIEAAATAQSRRKWKTSPLEEARLSDEVARWQDARAMRAGQSVVPVNAPTTTARALAYAFIALMVLLPIPLITVAAASTVGPFIAMIATPSFERSAAKMVVIEQQAHLALPTDSSITPMEAGEIFHVLSHVGGRPVESGGVRAPVRVHAEPWPTDAERPDSMKFEYSKSFARMRSLTPDEIAHLERVAAHPAQAEFTRLARAGEIDLIGGRMDVEALAGMTLFEVPIAKFGGTRETAYFHVAKALLEANRGQYAQAENTLREVVSVGILLAREGTMLIDLLIGTVIAGIGTHSLAEFYDATGRTAEANAIRMPAELQERMQAATAGLTPERSGQEGVRAAMRIAEDRKQPRGMRWEALTSIQVTTGCLNAHRAVFGRDESYLQWLGRVREDLVRYPSEQALFDLVLRGFSNPQDTRAPMIEKFLGLTLGRRSGTVNCASLMSAMSTMM